MVELCGPLNGVQDTINYSIPAALNGSIALTRFIDFRVRSRDILTMVVYDQQISQLRWFMCGKATARRKLQNSRVEV